MTDPEVSAALIPLFEEMIAKAETIPGMTNRHIGGAFFGAGIAMLIVESDLSDEEILAGMAGQIKLLRADRERWLANNPL